MSARFSYKKALEKDLLKDTELKRFAIITLLCAGSIKVNNKLAAYESDTTQASFPVVFRNMLKKLRDNDCVYTEKELGAAGDQYTGAISYKKAQEKGLLKEIELKRLAIVYLLHHQDMKLNKITNELAVKEADTTVASWPVVLRNSIKKIRDNDCEYTEEEETEHSATVAATPRGLKTGASKSRTGSRRKAKAMDDDNETATPSKKPRSSKPKKEDDDTESPILDARDRKIVEEVRKDVQKMDESEFTKEWLADADEPAELEEGTV